MDESIVQKLCSFSAQDLANFYNVLETHLL